MRLIAESKGIERLAKIRDEFRESIVEYEAKATPCSACHNPGICCRDAHFVNVRVTRLEAAAIKRSLSVLDKGLRTVVNERIEHTIETFALDDSAEKGLLTTYACPLFERGVGCLVHETAKPLPCIAHACYENASDQPPDNLLFEREAEIVRLNRSVYGRDQAALSLPVAIRNKTSSYPE